MYRGKGENKQLKFHSQLLDPVGRWTGNAFLFKGGLKLRTDASNKYQSCITILIIKYRVLQWKYGFGRVLPTCIVGFSMHTLFSASS